MICVLIDEPRLEKIRSLVLVLCQYWYFVPDFGLGFRHRKGKSRLIY
jgi:hypothetical protein